MRVASMSVQGASPLISMKWICGYCLNLANHPLLAVNISFPTSFCQISSKRFPAYAAIARWVRGILFWPKSSTHSVSNCYIFSYVKISSVTYIWCLQFCSFLCQLFYFFSVCHNYWYSSWQGLKTWIIIKQTVIKQDPTVHGNMYKKVTSYSNCAVRINKLLVVY